MSKVLGYIVNTVPYILCSFPVIVLVRIIFITRMKKKGLRVNWYHEVGLCLFIMFIAGVASQTVIPKLEIGNASMGIINGNLSGGINLIPGMVFVDIYRECFVNHYPLYFVINVLGNICLFLPIGFGIPLLWKDVSAKKVLLIALLSSLFIELCQFPQPRGADIDDLWINVLGAITGCAFYIFLNKSQHRFFEKFKLKTA